MVKVQRSVMELIVVVVVLMKGPEVTRSYKCTSGESLEEDRFLGVSVKKMRGFLWKQVLVTQEARYDDCILKTAGVCVVAVTSMNVGMHIRFSYNLGIMLLMMKLKNK